MSRSNKFIDFYKSLGNKIYLERLKKGLSRKQLSNLLEVADQQLYKYETGANKICIARLMIVARVLDKNIAYFYDNSSADDELEMDTMTDSDLMSVKVAKDFRKISNTKYQNVVKNLVQVLAKECNQIVGKEK